MSIQKRVLEKLKSLKENKDEILNKIKEFCSIYNLKLEIPSSCEENCIIYIKGVNNGNVDMIENILYNINGYLDLDFDDENYVMKVTIN